MNIKSPFLCNSAFKLSFNTYLFTKGSLVATQNVKFSHLGDKILSKHAVGGNHTSYDSLEWCKLEQYNVLL